jgi:hypothetical protein
MDSSRSSSSLTVNGSSGVSSPRLTLPRAVRAVPAEIIRRVQQQFVHPGTCARIVRKPAAVFTQANSPVVVDRVLCLVIRNQQYCDSISTV